MKNICPECVPRPQPPAPCSNFCIFLNIYIGLYTCTHIYTHIYVYIYMYVCVYTHIYIWTSVRPQFWDIPEHKNQSKMHNDAYERSQKRCNIWKPDTTFRGTTGGSVFNLSQNHQYLVVSCCREHNRAEQVAVHNLAGVEFPCSLRSF